MREQTPPPLLWLDKPRGAGIPGDLRLYFNAADVPPKPGNVERYLFLVPPGMGGDQPEEFWDEQDLFEGVLRAVRGETRLGVLPGVTVYSTTIVVATVVYDRRNDTAGELRRSDLSFIVGRVAQPEGGLREGLATKTIAIRLPLGSADVDQVRHAQPASQHDLMAPNQPELLVPKTETPSDLAAPLPPTPPPGIPPTAPEAGPEQPNEPTVSEGIAAEIAATNPDPPPAAAPTAPGAAPPVVPT